MPKEGVIARKLRAYFAELVKKHGEDELIPVYIRNGVLVMDWYMFEEDPNMHAKQLAPVSVGEKAADPFRRQVQP